MHKTLMTNLEKCVGCRICEQWCSIEHFGVVNPVKSRIRVIRIHETAKDVPLACTQCEPAPCIETCPKESITKDPDTGAVLVDDTCIGCQKCIKVCPNGAVSLLKESKKALICDLCKGDPVCVKVCPEGAVQYLSVSDVDKAFKTQAAREIACTRRDS